MNRTFDDGSNCRLDPNILIMVISLGVRVKPPHNSHFREGVYLPLWECWLECSGDSIVAGSFNEGGRGGVGERRGRGGKGEGEGGWGEEGGEGLLVIPFSVEIVKIGTSYGAKKMTTVRIIAVSLRVLSRKNLTGTICLSSSILFYLSQFKIVKISV